MNGKFLSGVLSGIVLVALAFVLGSALFPVEASRSIAAVAPKASEDPPVAGADTGTEAVAAAQSDENPQPADTDKGTPDAPTAGDAAPATGVAATPEPAAEATVQTEAPAAIVVVEPSDKVAAETAASGVTKAADSPTDSTDGATVAAEAEAPTADPSPATEPEPQVAVVEPAPAPDAVSETAPETAQVAQLDGAASAADPEAAPDVPSAVEPAALPVAPDLARLDAGAVLTALDRAATEQSPPASIDPAKLDQPDPAIAVEPAAESPAPVVTEPEPPAAVALAPEALAPEAVAPEAPAADTAVAEVEPPTALPTPDALADADDSAPEIPKDRAESSMPGTQPDGLPLQDEPLPEPEVAALPEPDADAATEPNDKLADGSAESTLEPAPRLGDSTKGVVVGRLPSIGGAATDETLVTDAAESAESAPDADPRPIAQFAATFENPDGKPTVAIVLIDPGTADLDRAGLASLPFPVSFALDPLDPATPDRAAIYRAAGKEVVMLATGIADGAQASDIEVAFQSMAQGLPEAVAVMDLAEPTFQNRRPLASIVVPVVGAQGRGLLTWDEGLNAADQVARREDIPAAVVFRDLTSGGTDAAAIRRVLDRAIFKAGQDGRAVVAGTASSDTVAALLEWSVEGKAATVALAPLTGVMAVD